MIRPSRAHRTGYAEKRESKPIVALVDNFRKNGANPAHGEMTDSVLIHQGGLQDADVQRLHAESSAPFNPSEVIDAAPGEMLERYDEFASGATLSFLDMSADNLQLVLDEMPSVRVINQSQSQTPARLVQTFMSALNEDAEFRGTLAAELGSERNDLGSVLTSLTQHTETLLRTSEEVSEARGRYDELAQRAEEKGIVNVIAGGNQGSLAGQFKQLGAQTSPSAFRSLLVNEHVTVVGASGADGEPMSLNSPNAGIEVYALGESVPVVHNGETLYANGTSVAAPLVAGKAAQMVQQSPELSTFQVENRLQGKEGYRLSEGESAQTLAGNSFVGDGAVDQWLLDEVGDTMLSGLNHPDMGQFVESKSNVRIGLPGDVEDQFQIVTARTRGQSRVVRLETYAGEQRHTVEALYIGGEQVPGTMTEEYFNAL